MRPQNPLEQLLRQTRRVNEWESVILDGREDVFGFLSPDFNQLHQALSTSDDNGRLPLIYFIAIASDEQLEQLFSNRAVVPYLEKLLGTVNPVCDIVLSEKLVAIRYIVSDNISEKFLRDNVVENFSWSIAKNKNLEIIKYFLSDQLPKRFRSVLLKNSESFGTGACFLERIALLGTLDAIMYVLSNALIDQFTDKFNLTSFFKKCALRGKLDVLEYFLSDEFLKRATQDQLKFLNQDFLGKSPGPENFQLYVTRRPEISAIFRREHNNYLPYDPEKCIINSACQVLKKARENRSTLCFEDVRLIVAFQKNDPKHFNDTLISILRPERKEELLNILKIYKETSDIDQLLSELMAQEEALTKDIASLKNKSMDGAKLGFFESRDLDLKQPKRNVVSAAIEFVKAKINGSDDNIQTELFNAFQLALSSNPNWNSGIRNTTERLVKDTLKLKNVTYNPRMKNPSAALVVSVATSGVAAAAYGGPPPVGAETVVTGTVVVPANFTPVVINQNLSAQLPLRAAELPVQSLHNSPVALFSPPQNLLANLVVPRNALVSATTVAVQQNAVDTQQDDEEEIDNQFVPA